MAADSDTAILSRMSSTGRLRAATQTGTVEFDSPWRVWSQTLGTTWIAKLALAIVVAGGALISIGGAHTNVLLPEFIQSSLLGTFSKLGLHLPVGAVIGVLALTFVAYLVVVHAAQRLSPASVLTAIAILGILVVLGPPLFSTDIFSYQAYAREWITYGANPYTAGPHVMYAGPGQADPIYSYIGAKWINTPSVYGPLFTALSAIVAPVTIAASMLAFKALAAIAYMTTVALIWSCAKLRGLNQTRAAALFALNPLVILYGVGGGHNDLLMVAAGMAAVYALLSHRERTAGALISVGAAIKMTGLLLAPFVYASGVGLGAPKRRRSLLVGFGLTTAALAIMSFTLFGTGMFRLILTLHTVQTEGDWHSIPGFIGAVAGYGGAGEVAGVILFVVFVVSFVWLLRRVWRGQMDWIDGAAWATLAILATASAVLPWYVSWLLPLTGLCTDRRLWRWTLVLSAVLMTTTLLGYIPHYSTFLGVPAS